MKKEFHTKLAGVTKRNDDEDRIQDLLKDISECCHEGELLSLEHESDNVYDENAIKVFYEFDHIGYIKRELAEKLAPLVDQQRVEAELCEITGGEDGKSFGCNILIRVVPEGETARTDSREYVHLGEITPRASRVNNPPPPAQRQPHSVHSDQSVPTYTPQSVSEPAPRATPWEAQGKDWVDKIAPALPLVYVLWFCGIAAAVFFVLNLIFK